MHADAWSLLFEAADGHFEPILRWRLVCRDANFGFFDFIRALRDSDRVFPKRTFILQPCMRCNGKNVKPFGYCHDVPPIRWLYSCKMWKCVSACLAVYLFDLKTEGVFPFVEWNPSVHDQSNPRVRVPRTAGGFSAGFIPRKSAIRFKNGSAYVPVRFHDVKSDASDAFALYKLNKLIPVEWSNVNSLPNLFNAYFKFPLSIRIV